MNISTKLEPLERCFGHQLSCVIFMSVGLNRIKKLWIEFIKSLWKDAFELNVNIMRDFYEHRPDGHILRAPSTPVAWGPLPHARMVRRVTYK